MGIGLVWSRQRFLSRPCSLNRSNFGRELRPGPLNAREILLPGRDCLAHDLFSMKDRVVVVTGSSRGIGRSIAEEMARAGAKVVISSRKIEACNELRDALRAEGADATAVACNAGRKDELQRLVDKTLEIYGRIDCVVSNAGINPVYGPLKDLPDEAWDKVMSTNVRSAWQLANMSLPEISRTGAEVSSSCPRSPRFAPLLTRACMPSRRRRSRISRSTSPANGVPLISV